MTSDTRLWKRETSAEPVKSTPGLWEPAALARRIVSCSLSNKERKEWVSS